MYWTILQYNNFCLQNNKLFMVLNDYLGTQYNLHIHLNSINIKYIQYKI